MTKEQFLSSVTTEIENAKKRKKEAEIAEKYYVKNNDFSDEYTAAKLSRIQAEKELNCLEQITDLPEILYYKFASNERLLTLKIDEMSKARKERDFVQNSIIKSRKRLIDTIKTEKELIDEYTTLSVIKNPTPEETRRLEELSVKAANIAKTKSRIRNVLAYKNDKKSCFNSRYETLSYMPIDAYRDSKINRSKFSTETMDIAKKAKLQLSGCEVFANGSSTPDKAKELAKLLVDLRETDMTEPEPVYFIIDDHEMPMKLRDMFFDSEGVFKGGKVINPDKAIEMIKKYIETVKKQEEKFKSILNKLDEIGTGLAALDKYEKVSKGRPILYGDPNNSNEQDNAIRYFEYAHPDAIRGANINCLNTDDLIAFNNLYDSVSSPIIFWFTREIKYKRKMIDIQIKLFTQMRTHLENSFNELDHLPFLNRFLYDKADDSDYIAGTYKTYDELMKMLQDLLEDFEDIKNEIEINKKNHEDEVQGVVDDILALANCKNYDINKLLISDSGDDLIAQIYENAAMYKVASLVNTLEYEAKCISLREEAAEEGISTDKLAVRKMDELTAKHDEEMSKKDNDVKQLEYKNKELDNVVKALMYDFD